MTKKLHFIADVHLLPGPCSRNSTFNEYVQNLSAEEVSRLLVLGDLFETWYSESPLLYETYRETLEALEKTARRGIEVDFTPGNRDFLFGDGTEKERFSYIRFHKGPILLREAKRTILATHGDELCVGDTGYRLWRRFSRQSIVKGIFRRFPERLKRRSVKRLSEASERAVDLKPPKAFEIPDSVYENLIRNGCDTVIHGHIHREEIRNYPESGGVVRTISDWISKPNALVYDPEEDFFTVKSLYYSR
jgi:UDP-2,3-diacylglucosamine hydrolase